MGDDVLILRDAKRIVIKVGTSSLTFSNNKPNFKKIERLVRTLSDLKNSGKEIVLVSSGAIAVGVSRMGLDSRPSTIAGRQAAAAVGQCELMFIYDKFFSEYGQTVAQILLTCDIINDKERKQNVINTFCELLKLGVIPIVNENDSVSTEELEGAAFGDNDNLSAIVARIIGADALIMLTDIDGLYDKNPNEDKTAKRIPVVEAITDDLVKAAGTSGSKRGTGGMATKLQAAKYATSRGITTAIVSGEDPDSIYALLEGKDIGTVFTA